VGQRVKEEHQGLLVEKHGAQMHENIVGIDAAIFMHPTTWKASGHVDNFSDPMIDNKDSKKRYRVDHLIEAKADELEAAGHAEQAELLLKQMDTLLANDDFAGLKTLIENNKIVCGVSGTANWTDVRQFNLMFSTEFGAVSSDDPEGDNKIYLRPETAQGIFVNFPERAKDRPDEDPVWYCTDRKGFPQRDRGPPVHFPHAGI
jgi:glycyl-tRNA synthetase